MQPPYRQCPECKNYVALESVQCPICERALPHLAPAAYQGQGYPPHGSALPPTSYRLQQQLRPPVPVAKPRNKALTGWLALLLGPFGAHGFYMGNTSMGGVMLLLTLFGMFTLIPLIPVVAISLVQAFQYWTSSEEEFYRKYVVEKRWF